MCARSTIVDTNPAKELGGWSSVVGTSVGEGVTTITVTSMWSSSSMGMVRMCAPASSAFSGLRRVLRP